jgi:pre-rRNA-processing protein IPI3
MGTSEASSARVAELEVEIESLREQLGKAKGINDVMWQTVLQKVMTQEGEDEGAERPRKKGKLPTQLTVLS